VSERYSNDQCSEVSAVVVVIVVVGMCGRVGVRANRSADKYWFLIERERETRDSSTSRARQHDIASHQSEPAKAKIEPLAAQGTARPSR